MSKLSSIFIASILLTVGSFVMLFAINPKKERETTIATQGIRLISSALFSNNTDGIVKQNKLKVGDLLLGNNEQVYRINEIRKTQTNQIYIVVSWKYITDYKTFNEYLSEPYTSYKTYELQSFTFNKTLITEPELEKFYNKNKAAIAAMQSLQKEKQVAISKNVSGASPSRNTLSQLNTIQLDRKSDNIDIMGISQESAPRNYMKASSNEVQAFSSTDIVTNSNLSKDAKEAMDSIIPDDLKNDN